MASALNAQPPEGPQTVETFADFLGVSFSIVPEQIRGSAAFAVMLQAEVSVVKPKRGGAWAGYTRASTKIEINIALFEDGSIKDVKDTFLHECAHLLANGFYKKSCHHDRRWRAIALALGDDGSRCHNYHYLNRRSKDRPYSYRCTGWMCEASWHFAKPLRYGGRHHRCNECGALITRISPGLDEYESLIAQTTEAGA